MEAKNILFIFSDEQNRDFLGCYGHPLAHTPNLDALAEHGTRFTSAYTNCPICVPARASLATGRYVHQIGYWDNAFPDIWACDFVQTYDLFFRTIFIFFIVELGSRRVVHFGVIRSPDDAWMAQLLREATQFGKGPHFLICDNDNKYGDQFERVAQGTGIDVIHTPVEAPRANAVCERFIGSVRRELLDHILILSERHLRSKVKEYVKYFNHACPHQGTKEQIPVRSTTASCSTAVSPAAHSDSKWLAS